MGRVTKSNLPQNVPLKWNVEKAAAEFGLTIMTLRKALSKDSTRPGEDGCYSTKQICEALFGDMHKEKIATQRQITERITLENQITSQCSPVDEKTRPLGSEMSTYNDVQATTDNRERRRFWACPA
jgi:hypothetical protein